MKVYALLLKLETMASVGWGGCFLVPMFRTGDCRPRLGL